MKRILLTTTSLVLAAGVAQADVSFSGMGEVSYAQAGAADDMVQCAQATTLNIAMSGASDNGITYLNGCGHWWWRHRSTATTTLPSTHKAWPMKRHQQ